MTRTCQSCGLTLADCRLWATRADRSGKTQGTIARLVRADREGHDGEG